MLMYLEEKQLIEKKISYIKKQIRNAEEQRKFGAAKDLTVAILDYYDLLAKIDTANNKNSPLEIDIEEAEMIFDPDLEKNLADNIRKRYYTITHANIVALDKL